MKMNSINGYRFLRQSNLPDLIFMKSLNERLLSLHLFPYTPCFKFRTDIDWYGQNFGYQSLGLY